MKICLSIWCRFCYNSYHYWCIHWCENVWIQTMSAIESRPLPFYERFRCVCALFRVQLILDPIWILPIDSVSLSLSLSFYNQTCLIFSDSIWICPFWCHHFATQWIDSSCSTLVSSHSPTLFCFSTFLSHLCSSYLFVLYILCLYSAPTCSHCSTFITRNNVAATLAQSYPSLSLSFSLSLFFTGSLILLSQHHRLIIDNFDYLLSIHSMNVYKCMETNNCYHSCQCFALLISDSLFLLYI